MPNDIDHAGLALETSQTPPRDEFDMVISFNPVYLKD